MKRLIIAAALLLASVGASAQGVSYNYLSLGYERVSASGGVDGDGLGIGGSFEFAESWYGFVGYSSLDLDFGSSANHLALGAGWHTALTANTDFFASLAYIDVNAKANGFTSLGDNGIGASIGVRGMLTPVFELQGSISYTDLGGGSSGTSLGVIGWYSFTESFAGGLSIESGDDADGFGLGVRWYYGR